jgi:hypothetical protein
MPAIRFSIHKSADVLTLYSKGTGNTSLYFYVPGAALAGNPFDPYLSLLKKDTMELQLSYENR